MNAYDVLIVGAGHGGAQAAAALRQAKFEGSVAVIGDEPELPYERPPLSKEYLSGEKPFERLLIRPAGFWDERNIAMLLGRRVASVDPDKCAVTTADGKTIGYTDLIWAAGGAARSLPSGGHHLRGVHTVRTRADVDRMASELPQADCVVVVGGGYVGLEAAAVLAMAGKRVIVLEAQERVLSRVAGAELSAFIEAEHRAHGVEIRAGTQVERLLGEDFVTGVRLGNGQEIACQMVIVGIGIIPSIDPLMAAGINGGDGVDVDAQCRTSLRRVFAVGDCARHANRYAGGARIRLESVQNAADQATVAARVIVGLDAQYDAVPWFWSNQYDIRLQTVGLSAGHDATVIRGEPAKRSFSVIYLKAGRVVALDCVNAVRDYVQGRRLVLEHAAILPEKLADTTMSLKDLVAD